MIGADVRMPRVREITRRAALAAIAAMSLSALSGCGYSLAGRGSFLPDYIRTIAIPNFANNTTVFDVEQVLTVRVRNEFIGRGRYKIVSDLAGADAVLLGTIVSIGLVPTAFNDQQLASRYLAIVVMKIEFKELRDNKILWENAGLVFRDEFEVVSGVGAGALDANAFFGQSSNALERVATEFARTVVTSILEAF